MPEKWKCASGENYYFMVKPTDTVSVNSVGGIVKKSRIYTSIRRVVLE